MHSVGINGKAESRGQLANTGSPGKIAVKTECVVCVCVWWEAILILIIIIVVQFWSLLMIKNH